MALRNVHKEALTCGCVIYVYDRTNERAGAFDSHCPTGRELMTDMMRSTSRNARECTERDALYAHYEANRSH